MQASATALKTRFAPSPTGRLHLGHVYSAFRNAQIAREIGGTFFLRIENLDLERSGADFERGIFEDLAWLGLTWPDPVRRQSDHLDIYAAALNSLENMGLLFPCSCRRRDIRAALDATPTFGPDGPVYPGICRHRPMSDRRPGDALRLDMGRAMEQIEGLEFWETGPGAEGLIQVMPKDLIGGIGDVVLRRRDTEMPAYHLAVVVDDAAQQITHVVRGQDLAEATAIHVLLQHLLDLPHPIYHHHALIRDDTGKRLAKSHQSRAIQTFREQGETPMDIQQRIVAQIPEFRLFPAA